LKTVFFVGSRDGPVPTQALIVTKEQNTCEIDNLLCVGLRVFVDICQKNARQAQLPIPPLPA